MATNQQEELKIEQLQHANPDELDHAAGREREQLEGWIPALASDTEVRDALEKAFDYRGDITVSLKDGSQVVGYLFDRRTGSTLESSSIRMIPANAKTRITVSYADVAGLTFSGARHGRGQDLRRLGEEVLGKEGGG